MVATVLVSCSRGATVLSVDGEPGGLCQAAVDAADWEDLQRTPTVFGLDYFRVHGDARITVTSVEMIGGPGRLKVVGVSFAPGGGVGSFTDRPGLTRSQQPAGFRDRIRLPAVLTAQGGEPADRGRYQLVVEVLATDDRTGSNASRISYQVDGRQHVVQGRDFLTLSRNQSGC